MKNLIQHVKRILIVGLISFSMWGVGEAAFAADTSDYYTNERGTIQATERYDSIQSKQDGMNTFSDTDPRRNTSKADAKAQTLKDVAKRRSEQADSPLEPATEAISNLADQMAESASDLAQ